MIYLGTKTKSESVADLRPTGLDNASVTIQSGHSTVTLKSGGPGSKWRLGFDKDFSGTISGLNYRSPLINHRARINEKHRADQAMASMEMEMLGMLGRIHVELKGFCCCKKCYFNRLKFFSNYWFCSYNNG